jgi:hypothetical protein
VWKCQRGQCPAADVRVLKVTDDSGDMLESIHHTHGMGLVVYLGPFIVFYFCAFTNMFYFLVLPPFYRTEIRREFRMCYVNMISCLGTLSGPMTLRNESAASVLDPEHS